MPVNSKQLQVDEKRLLGSLARLATIGGTPAGGVSRPAYGDLDIAARKAVRTMMEAAGLVPRIDRAGNTFARRGGHSTDRPPIIIGSHTDTVPDGGRFDGALGVMAAIEVARTIHENNIQLKHPLEVVDFQNEEGGLIGSKIVAGKFTADATRLDIIISEQGVGGLVVGLPLNMDGSDGPSAQSARAFGRNWAGRSALPVVFQDERLSTSAVTRTLLEADASRKRRSDVVDKMAAAYILQGALDRLRNLR